MTGPRLHSRHMQLLDAALDVDPADRRRVLEEAGASEDEVERVLEAFAGEDVDFLATPAAEALSATDTEALPGVPRFTVLRSLGKGGMGQVLLAQQTEPVERLVAIKLIRAAWLDDDLTGRFRAEQQALARLNHPAIAQFYEAGSTSDGRPFVVMEFVDGQPLTSWCVEKQAPVERRLSLFVSVCRGVEHAHRRLVLHRDLKPSNLLVTSGAEGPAAKIIDFGIARSLGGRLSEESPRTGTAVLGTPDYMSPEAFAGADLDTRTDVYSLGVVLYELLTGTRPFEESSADPTGWMLRRTTEAPERPSIRRRETQRGSQRGPERVLELPKRLRNDLDWIALRALAPDRDARYGSAAELADDIERALRDEPVSARPPGPFDRVARLARRYRTATAITLASVMLGAVLSTTSLWRARQAEAQARSEAATSEEVIDFMVDLFEAARPSSEARGDVTAQELVLRGAERLADGDFPALQRARLLQTLADVQLRLGDFTSGRGLAGQALVLREAELPPDHPDVIATLELLGNLERRAGELDAASPRLERVLEAAERTGNRPALADALNSLANLRWRQERLEEAEKLHRRALEIRRTLDDPSATAASLNNVGVLLWSQKRFAEAEIFFQDALGSYEEILGPDHPRVADTLGNLGLIRFNLSDFEGAAALQQRSLQIRERTLGTDHPETASALNNLATALRRLDRLQASERAYRRALAIRLEALGPDHSDTRLSIRNLASLLRATDRPSEAEALEQQ